MSGRRAKQRRREQRKRLMAEAPILGETPTTVVADEAPAAISAERKVRFQGAGKRGCMMGEFCPDLPLCVIQHPVGGGVMRKLYVCGKHAREFGHHVRDGLWAARVEYLYKRANHRLYPGILQQPVVEAPV